MVRDPLKDWKGKLQAPDDYRGGGGYGDAAQNYFYLVVRSGPSLGLSSGDILSFYKSAVNTSIEHIFVLVDISSDVRLENDLKKLVGGPELFARIEQSAPLFLIARKPIPRISDVQSIELYPIADYKKDVDVIYAKMGLNSFSTRRAAINFLRAINKYVHLKPNLLGVGANFNEAISDFLDRLERTAP
jgi:hypothetical protein